MMSHPSKILWQKRSFFAETDGSATDPPLCPELSLSLLEALSVRPTKTAPVIASREDLPDFGLNATAPGTAFREALSDFGLNVTAPGFGEITEKMRP